MLLAVGFLYCYRPTRRQQDSESPEQHLNKNASPDRPNAGQLQCHKKEMLYIYVGPMVTHAAFRSKIQKIRLRQNNIIREGDNAKSKSQHWALPVWISLSKNVGLS